MERGRKQRRIEWGEILEGWDLLSREQREEFSVLVRAVLKWTIAPQKLLFDCSLCWG